MKKKSSNGPQMWFMFSLSMLVVSVLGCSHPDFRESRGSEGTFGIGLHGGQKGITSGPAVVNYRSDSIFHQRIVDNPEIDPNSTAMVARLAKYATQGLVVATDEWAIPIFYADESTPRYDVRLKASWRPFVNNKQIDYLKNVPIPDSAQPDPMDDGHMTIINLGEGYEYDFWQMRKVNDSWQASWGNRIALDSSGVYPNGMSSLGSGIAGAAGLIWPQELQSGIIQRKLVFTVPPKVCTAGGPVPPATESDGTSTGANSIPEGAILQLDTSIDVNDTSHRFTKLEKIIAKAMQDYGVIIGDVGSSEFGVRAVSPLSYPNNPYIELIRSEETWHGYIFLRNISISDLRVLKLPPQYDPALSVADESIYR
jgi:hypothetical protein